MLSTWHLKLIHFVYKPPGGLHSNLSPTSYISPRGLNTSKYGKSEMFTPVVFAGGVVAVAALLAVVEAVTARVSAYRWLEVNF